MALVYPLQVSYQQGMRQDEARGMMGPGVLWNCVDLIPNIDNAPLGKRGGWAFGSSSISAVSSSATYQSAVAYPNFSAGAKLVTIDQRGELYTVNTSSLSVTDIGATVAPVCNPVFHGDKLIIPASDGTTSPKYYDGNVTVGALAGSPPAGKFAAVYKDRTVLGPTASNITKTYFSAASDPTTWDTTNTWISTLSPPVGYASLPNALMIFQATNTSRIRGSTPPPGSDFIIDDPIFQIGCTDARSIAVNGNYACFANPQGVFLTNGTASPEDLTASCGIKKLWNTQLASYSASSWTLAGGFIRNTYVISILNGASFVDAFMFNINDRAVIRVSNLYATCFAPAVTVQARLYFGLRNFAKLGELSTVFTPSATYKNDGDGTAVAPVFETGLFRSYRKVHRSWRPAYGQARWKNVYLGYDVRDAATDNPVLTISYVKNSEDGYTAISPTFVEGTNYGQKRLPLNFTSETVGIKVAQSNASSTSRFYTVSADSHPKESSRLV